MTQANTSQALRYFSNPITRSRMVRWMLEECEAEYETVVLEYGPAMKAPEYLALNPMGKVPALQHGAAVITETGAILAYLADMFAHKNLAPTVGSPERAAYYRWLFFIAGPVEAVTTAKAGGWLEQQTEQQAVMAGYGRFDDVVRTLQHAIGGKRYVCGDHFKAADLYLASYVGWSTMEGTLPALPEFKAYFEPLLQRPASLRADALDGPMESMPESLAMA